MMHNFLGVDGDNRPDVSILRDASARSRARDNVRMIADYRGDVGALRSAASLGGAAVDVLGHPQRAVERMREAILPALPAGEPTRRDSHVRGEDLPRRNSDTLATPPGDTPQRRDPNGRATRRERG